MTEFLLCCCCYCFSLSLLRSATSYYYIRTLFFIRFAKLLLRLPALRSIGLKCMEHLFFYKILKEDMGLMNEDHASRLEVFIREALDE